ncbi:N-glycosylase/DNA lyase-like isoform X2 [Oculina patagonica]
MSSAWRLLSIDKSKVRIRLDLTLASGQSFRWKETAPGEWTNVLFGYVWTLKQNKTDFLYRVYESVTVQNKRVLKEICSSPKEKECDIYESILRDYFQLHVDTDCLFKQWRSRDAHFFKVSENMLGVRVLRQDPVETLFAFICSSNNNIPRISGMVEKLCQEYGEKLGEINGVTYFAFPDIRDLKGSKIEEHLRSVGFGYRAKFVSQCASYILQHHGSKWLENLRSVCYDEAHAALCQLPGVGAKVADCVCLMSLDKHEAVPVDTHLWQITAKHYMPQLVKTKSLTAKVYRQIGDHYRHLFGEYAGWAQSVLFAADLKRFQDPQSISHASLKSSETYKIQDLVNKQLQAISEKEKEEFKTA